MLMASTYSLEISDSKSRDVTCNDDDDEEEELISKPSASLLKLIGCNILIFGLELCSSAGFTYISPILLKNGFSDKNLSSILGIGPFISLIFVPIIGRWSDKCQSRFGRRRPFMLALGIITIVSLLIIPYSYEIFTYFSIINPSYGLAAGVIMFDFSSQALLNPCKALISDMLTSEKEQNSGFTVYSCMLSLGGCLGYLITSLNWARTLIGVYFGGQEKAIFSTLSIFLLILLIINLFVAQEEPFNEILCKMDSLDKNSNGITLKNSNHCIAESLKEIPFQNNLKSDSVMVNEMTEKCAKFFNGELINDSSIIVRMKFKFQSIFYSTELQIKNGFRCIFEEYFFMPPVLFKLFIASLFGWMGVMCHDMYYTDFVGQVIYKGRPQAERESSASNLYDEGIRMGSWGLLLHCLSSALYAAFFQKELINKYGTYLVYLQGLLYFSLSMLGTAMTTNLFYANIFSALSGIGYAVLTTVPYSLITEYYSKKEVYYNSYCIRGAGKDMAVLDVAYFLSQIIPSLILGSIVEFTKSSSTYMVVAAVCGVAASYFACFVTFPS